MSSKVYIICGVHNGLENTKKLLDCIGKQTYRDFQTIIIDDGSTDNTFSFINKEYPEVVLIKGNGKLYWTGALFEGVDWALKSAKKEDFILTINNDCTFEKNYIENLIKLAGQKKNSIIGSMAVDSKSRTSIHDAGVRIDWKAGKFIQLSPRNISDLPLDETYQANIDTLTTKGTLYPMDVFKRIGNFDKYHLPHYVSDYEFNCRAKRKGYELILNYQARVYNDVRNTGFGEDIPDKLNLYQFFEMLFARRSRVNILDNFWFITLCCPNKYKLWNYLLLLGKISYLVYLLFPFKLLLTSKK